MAVGPSAAYRVTPWCQGPLKSSWEPCAVRSHGRPCSGGTPPFTPLSPPCRVGARFCRASLSVLRGTGFICYSLNQMMTEHPGGALWAGGRAMNHVDVNP